MTKIFVFLIIAFTNIVINYTLNTSSIFLNTLFKNDLQSLSLEKKYNDEINCFKTLPQSSIIKSYEMLITTKNYVNNSKIAEITPYYKAQIVDFTHELDSQKNETANSFPFDIIFSISSNEMKYETTLDIDTLKVEIYSCNRSILFQATLTKGETLYLHTSLPHAYNLFRFQYGNNLFFSKFIEVSDVLNHVQIVRNNKFIIRVI